MPDKDVALMAHLLRRAGFGATRLDLEAYCAKGYEATVEELLHPENQPSWEEDNEDLEFRYFLEYKDHQSLEHIQAKWVYRMVNTKRLLEEKIGLLWHSIFCTGYAKVDHSKQMYITLDMFRRHGLGNFKNLLVELAKDPGMLYFLDNNLSHKEAINENWGRELLELFSLGVGMDGQPNYTEEDVKVCARAFTGWTRGNPIPQFPFGKHDWGFVYYPNDHDDSEKNFLGEMGRFNGEDVIDIIMRQPSCARFISRHLYNFFVADEVQVPSWQDTPPRDIEAIRTLERALVENNYDIRSVLRVLFNSDFFKEARFTKMKSPAEVVAGTMRLVQDFTFPRFGFYQISLETRYMGQDLLNPPSVEGWHTGKEWIDSGSLVERVNFVADQMGNTDLPGVKAIVNRLAAQGTMSTEQLVEGCLDLIGPVEVSKDSYKTLLEHARQGGDLRNSTEEERIDFTRRVGEMLQLIAAVPEYQFG